MKRLSLAFAGLLLAACSAAAPAATVPPGVTPAQPTVPPATPAGTVPAAPTDAAATAAPASLGPSPSIDLPDLVGEVPQEILLPIMQEVANATGSTLADLTLVEARAVTWSDASLGCPEPGQMYTQALVDGFWVVIEVEGIEYDFRVGENGAFRLCPEGQGEPPADLPN